MTSFFLSLSFFKVTAVKHSLRVVVYLQALYQHGVLQHDDLDVGCGYEGR